MGMIVMALGALVYAGLVGLMLALNHGGHTGTHPRPEAPGIGEDLDTDDPDAEREHTAWL